MPFKSEKQRHFMHANLPDLAQKWEHKYGSKPSKVEAIKNIQKKRKKNG